MRFTPALVLLAGCAAAPLPTAVSVPETPGNWCEGAVTIVVSDEFEDDCLDNIAVAIEFWRGVGVTYITAGLAPEGEMAFDEAYKGVVQMFPTSYLGEGVLGLCSTGRRAGETCISAAQIELVSCDIQTVTHEIGHALGLPHVEDESNLMNPYNTGHMGLNDAQRESVK
jgi:hypothetical protein